VELPKPLRAFVLVEKPLAGAIARTDALLARYRSVRDAGQILPNAVEAMRVELTYHSNALEGSTLTLRDTQLVVEGREPNTGKSLREIYEARNHDRALRRIERGAFGTPITQQELLDIHAEVLADIDAAGAGRFRSDRVLITGTRFVPPGSHRFGELIPALLERADSANVHPVVQAAELHYNFVAIHPFSDGNGRAARLLLNAHLLRRGGAHVIVPVEERARYLSTLEEVNAGQVQGFTLFILECVQNSILQLIGNDSD